MFIISIAKYKKIIPNKPQREIYILGMMHLVSIQWHDIIQFFWILNIFSDIRNLKLRSIAFQYILKNCLLLYSIQLLFQLVFIDFVRKANYFKISN